MSILVITELTKGKIKKSSLEAINYAAAIAKGSPVTALVLSCTADADLSDAGKAGATKVLTLAESALNYADTQVLCKAVTMVVASENSGIIVFSHDFTSKAVAPRLAAALKAGMVPAAVALPDTGAGFVVTKNVFSGKATADYELHSDKKIICLLPNTFPVTLTGAAVSASEAAISLSDTSGKIKVRALKKNTGSIHLTDAELVVSAGRGMKGPENWGMVEELATELGAATACSRPVSDIGWRPHHEHVGQTGIAIRPNLYIAIGISGAIQHLAGVNGSKTIVVINKDPEAPFFKAADYGIVGDAFDVVPKITQALKKFKTQSH
ncbi:MAG: electron transfer flavoprotein subunit alpha/FixB family protein [Bacteroidota bacterium]|jgi:electron transfer flavoprotein alpha subunit